MIRTFREHLIRQTDCLDGQWDFLFDPENVGIQENWQERFPETSQKLFVPACWNNELHRYDYEGVAWYRTTVRCLKREHLRLIFHAVLGHADVYWDGMHLGHHFGGYTPFEFVLENQDEGMHELIVRTDSTLDQTTIPIDVVDWFHYGGIIRPVEVQRLDDIYFDLMRVTYTLTETDQASINIRLALRSLAADRRQTAVRLEMEGAIIYENTVALDAGETLELNIVHLENGIRRWHVGRPELYTFRAATDTDDLADRTGFRTIETKNGKLVLNGEDVYLQGVNRHEEHPEWGFAFPPKLMSKDLDIILELGCNSVRGSHYPQSKYWLDLMDERGLLFWSEIPMWGALMEKEVLAQPVFIERSLVMMGEMIERDYHHPSIIFWSVHNEIPTYSQEAYALSVKLTELVRSKDTSRLITYATMHPHTDICLPLFDVIGINKYCGWYESEVSGFKQLLEQFHKHAEELGAGDRPVLMTEFGAAGIYGDTGWEPRLFSEDYQAHVISEALRIFHADPKIVGTYIWQFADIRGDLQSDRSCFRDRARSFNNKGLVNEYRKPKLAYRVTRDIYRSKRQ